jgi:hypothetical protein
MTEDDRSTRIQELEGEIRVRGAEYEISDDLDEGISLRERLAARDCAPPYDLWKLIAYLAEMNIVIENTNHLDDAALLEFLVAFLEEPVVFPDLPDLVMHIDVLGSGSEEDINLYLRYYASDDDRQEWMREFPAYDMPPRRMPPFDRDRFLPKAYEEVIS